MDKKILVTILILLQTGMMVVLVVVANRYNLWICDVLAFCDVLSAIGIKIIGCASSKEVKREK
ncbi:hypothetical protein [Aminicella lysinilytica]|uniref:Uncharacterized protein n=1 Tax=Aminicella lysinilytica TaxID=433323 RepID=A0A4R6PY19_9FIRM|nr:hypothetical protein [Aminicella lysinilytica]TDP51853.1 hypothetical protein EV211_12931 [Aminicella lysinilytica]